MNKEELSTEVLTAIGEASMCWQEVPTGVFDSDRAKRVAENLLIYIESSVITQIREEIARKIEADHKSMTRQTYDGSFEACQCGFMSYPCQLGARAAAIARGENK